jgi:hypothetical protein
MYKPPAVILILINITLPPPFMYLSSRRYRPVISLNKINWIFLIITDCVFLEVETEAPWMLVKCLNATAKSSTDLVDQILSWFSSVLIKFRCSNHCTLFIEAWKIFRISLTQNSTKFNPFSLLHTQTLHFAITLPSLLYLGFPLFTTRTHGHCLEAFIPAGFIW